MNANKLWILRDFIGANKVLFRIPVYQRNYDWSETNCIRILDDIYNIAITNEKHFLGTIVYMSSNGGGFALQEYTIIDGQQRLTTLMIMLKALSCIAAKTGDPCYQEIEEQYLHNKWCEEEYKVKLKPVKTDNEQFLLMLRGKVDEMDQQCHVYLNYRICEKRIRKWLDMGISPSRILLALAKLEIVEIVLTRGEDDPQIIFESINSTGLDLSNADLIRNFLLMNADNQDLLYEDYWLYIEKALKRDNDYSNLDMFFMQYIVYKTSAPVTTRQLYAKFVNHFKASSYTQESNLKELKYYADIFKTFVYGNDKYSYAVNKTMRSIRLLNQTTCYPFLIHVFDDYNQNAIPGETFERVLHLILSYLVRRMVCSVPSNTLRSFFIYLYNRVFKVVENKKKYYEAINKFLYTVTSKDVVPPKTEFERCLQNANLYGNPALCKLLLMDIENQNSKETLNAENLTIEHIMPQTLTSDWRHISTENHELLLHTLGNLSVSGYNSELSNKSFEEKKNIIRENSKAAVLNKDVLSQAVWSPREIRARGRRLTDIVLRRYNIDRVDDDSIEFEYLMTITLDNYDEVTGKKLVSFTLENDTYRQSKYSLMLLDVIKLLNKRSPGKLLELAKENYSFSTSKNKHAHLSTTIEGMRWGWEVIDGVYMEANLSAWSCIRFIECLLSEYGVNQASFSFNVIAEDTSRDDEEQ